MRVLLCALVALLLSDQLVRAQGCTLQTIQQLQQRGVHPQTIASMCGTGGASAAGATVCATPVGACAFRGPVNVPCTCSAQFGTIQGVSR